MTRHSANEYLAVELVVQLRRWTLNEKIRIVKACSLPTISVSYVARKNGIAPTLLFRWRKLMSEGGRTAVKANDQVVFNAEVKTKKKRILELERMLGRKAMQFEILQEGVR